MKNKRVLLALLALCLAVTAVTGSAWAYFTTNVTAAGSHTLQLGSSTTITETMEGQWTKRVTITAGENSQPLYVRVRAYVIADQPLVYAGTDWVKGSDGWYYYTGRLANPATDGATAATTALDISFNTDPTKYPEEFDVPVVYETAPVRYNVDGTAKPSITGNTNTPNGEIWNQTIEEA